MQSFSLFHPPQAPIKRLINLIAGEENLHRLISLVATDAALLEVCRTVYLQANDGTWPQCAQVAKFCRHHQRSQDYFLERLRLIVFTLNLVEHQQDHYELLGIERHASREEIKRAFRTMSLACHPDTNPDDAEAPERFRQIHQAYEILSNDNLRQHYDQEIARPVWLEKPRSGEPAHSALGNKHGRRYLWQLGVVVGLLLALSFLVDYQSWLIPRKLPISGKRNAAEEKARKSLPLPLSWIEQSNSSLANLSNDYQLKDGWVLPAESKASTGSRKLIATPLPSAAGGSGSNARASVSAESSPGERLPAKGSQDKSEGREDSPERASQSMGSSADHIGKSKPESLTKSVAKSFEQPRAEGDKQPKLKSGEAQTVSFHKVRRQIQDFLNSYTGAYERKDLVSFLNLFEPGALENGQAVENLISNYQDNFERVQRFRYQIDVKKWTLLEDGVNLNGAFRLGVHYADATSTEAVGSIQFNLVNRGEEFKVRRLEYRFKNP